MVSCINIISHLGYIVTKDGELFISSHTDSIVTKDDEL